MSSSARYIGLIFAIAFCAVASSTSAVAGTVCDLRPGVAGSTTSCSILGGQFFTDEQHPTGTGFIDSFARIQQNGWEQGYNTSARPLQADVQMKVDPNFTRNLTLGEVGTKTINGTVYREFFLDVNEPAAANKNWITLDQLEVFVSNQGSLNNYSAATPNSSAGALAGATKIYDLDNGSDNYVQLDYAFKGSGSGSSDMVFYLADALFTNRAASSFVYLFSQFGDLGLQNGPSGDDKSKFDSQAGFEEWFTKAIPPPNTNVPEPTTALLVGTGLAGAWWRRRRA